MELIRFMQLFAGNERHFGRFIPKKHSIFMSHSKIEAAHYKKHLAGEEGVAIVPILDNNTSFFGAIDIDNHIDDGSNKKKNEHIDNVDLYELDFKIRELDLPLTVCRSKSGSAHLYFFANEPIKSTLVRKALSKWASDLGYPAAEIFPKQKVLIKDPSGSMQNGTPINIPFFDWENERPLRYAVEGGKKIKDLFYFLDIAESKKISSVKLVEIIDDSHDESPPCISKMISGGVPSGFRNVALFNLAIYLKKSHPETWRDKAYDLNARVFDEALDYAEAKKIITSVSRKEYKYKCSEEPCKSRCNASLCVTKKYGITPDEKSELELGKMPDFTGLQKIETDPVKWFLHIGDFEIPLSTSELMDFRRIREAVAEKMTMLIPAMKNDKWQIILNTLMQKAEKKSAPEEASTTGIIKERLLEFLKKADLKSSGENIEDRQLLRRGMPVVQVYESKRYIYFKGIHFINFLKQQRTEEAKGANLWLALDKLGVEHRQCKIPKSEGADVSVVNIWAVPLEDEIWALDLGVDSDTYKTISPDVDF